MLKKYNMCRLNVGVSSVIILLFFLNFQQMGFSEEIQEPITYTAEFKPFGDGIKWKGSVPDDFDTINLSFDVNLDPGTVETEINADLFFDQDNQLLRIQPRTVTTTQDEYVGKFAYSAGLSVSGAVIYDFMLPIPFFSEIHVDYTQPIPGFSQINETLQDVSFFYTLLLNGESIQVEGGIEDLIKIELSSVQIAESLADVIKEGTYPKIVAKKAGDIIKEYLKEGGITLNADLKNTFTLSGDGITVDGQVFTSDNQKVSASSFDPSLDLYSLQSSYDESFTAGVDAVISSDIQLDFSPFGIELWSFDKKIVDVSMPIVTDMEIDNINFNSTPDVITYSTSTSNTPVTNNAPVSVGSISPSTLLIGNADIINISDKFTDPDGDTLTYTVESSNSSVATVSISGSTATISAVSAGTTTITITATDGNVSVTQTFSVTVNAPYQAPTVGSAVPAQTLTVGDTALTLDVSAYFNNPGGNTLTYTATSSNSNVATASISGSTATISAVSVGTTTITVNATDGNVTLTQTFSVTVNARYQAPTVGSAIPAQTLTEGDTALTLDVSTYFNNPGNNTLTYTATSSNSNVATASISGSTATISAVSAGTTTITVNANDGNVTVTQTFSITVNPRYQAPTAGSAIPAQTLTEGGTALTLDVSTYFNNPGGNTLTYTATSSNSSVATASISGSTATISAVSAGTTTITVNANDGNVTVTQTFSVTVNARYQAPAVGSAIPAQTLTEGDTALTLDVSAYFNNPDNKTLTYTVSSNNSSVATVNVSGSNITITPQSAGSATITITASDGELTATQTISVTVTSQVVSLRSLTVNASYQAPAVGSAIPAQTMTEGDTALTLDVSTYFNNPGGNTLTYTVESSNSSVATASISGSTATISAVAAGTTTITVNATDGNVTVTQTFSVTVNAPYQAPTVGSAVPAKTMTVGDTALTLDVSTYFNNPGGNTLTYTATSSTSSVATASISGSTVTISAVAAGITTITVNATDGNVTLKQTFSVTVNPQYRAPTVKSAIPAKTMTVGDTALTLDVSTYFNNPGGNTLTYTVESSTSSVATASISASKVTISAVSAGTTRITITANDGNTTVTQTISVTVNAPNRAPTVGSAIPAKTMTEGDAALVLDVSTYFNNPGGNTLTYTATSSNSSVATASISASKVTISAVTAGTTRITITANDGNATVTQIFSVTVNALYRAPTVEGSIPAQTMAVGDAALVLDVSAYFNNSGGNTLTYTVESSNSSIATASISGSTVTISAVAAGTTTITVNATDGNTTVTQTISVTVNEANRAPTAVGSIPAQTTTVGSWALSLGLSAYFSDPDDDTLSYSATSSDTGVATVSVSRDNLTITNVAEGTAAITVTATDGSLTATQTISVTVNPGTVTEIPDVNLLASLQRLLNLSSDSKVTEEQLMRINSLYIPSLGISDLTGLESATNLTRLGLQGNDITDLTPLAGLTKLRVLYLDSNDITDVTPLAGLTKLTEVYLDRNEITDISALSGWTNVKELFLLYNQITDISALSGLTKLTKLHLRGNSITAISSLSGLTNLKVLYLAENRISDISALSGLTNLTELYIWTNSISDISAVANLTNLTSLDFGSNSISDISDLSGLTKITKLYLEENSISDISALSSLTKISRLWLNDNNITDVSALESLTELTYLLIADNPITDYAPLRRLQAGSPRTIVIDVDISTDPGMAPLTVIPTETALLPNFPNPFNPETWIPYQLAKPTDVTLTFYNIQGEIVRKITLGNQQAGVYYQRERAAYWDGKNELGEKVTSGAYFVKFQGGQYTKIRKMLIMK